MVMLGFGLYYVRSLVWRRGRFMVSLGAWFGDVPGYVTFKIGLNVGFGSVYCSVWGWGLVWVSVSFRVPGPPL